MTELATHSVTRDDALDAKRGGGVLLFNVWQPGFYSFSAMPPTLDAAWSTAQDSILSSTVRHEAMWASAVSKAITKMASLGWTISDADDSSRRVERVQELLLRANGQQGWVNFLSKHLHNFLTTNNGAFVEVVRASGARGARVLGLMHLSSKRCQRTGDPDYPVVYTDRRGKPHLLRDDQVLMFSDMPSPDDSLLDVGWCAAARAYKTIYKLAALEQYVSEKIAGNRALALHFVSGLAPQTLADAIATADAEQARKGAIAYKGAVVVPIMGDQGVTLVTVPLAEIPDGFDAKTERDNAYLIYANAIGVPVQDIQPLSGQGLGTGTQTLILDEAAEGQGLAAWRKAWEHAINMYVTPATTTFAFATNDIRDQKAKAEVAKSRAETRALMVQTGTITPQQSLQLAADADDVPAEFLPHDDTPQGQLTDTEKPAAELAASSAPAPGQQPALPAQAPAPSPLLARMLQRTKAAPTIDAVVDRATQGIADATARLEAGEITVDEWLDAMDAAIVEAHQAAYAAGSGGAIDQALIDAAVEGQRGYLQAFAEAIRSGQASEGGWANRASMYADSARASYWAAKTRGLPLPAVPGDGTSQCVTRCRCSWDIQELEGEGNVDAYWRRGATDSCQSCIERAAQWSPYRIRGGEVVL